MSGHRLLSKRYRGTLMTHVTVTWRQHHFKSDKFSNRHDLLQVSHRSVFMALHEVEHTLYVRWEELDQPRPLDLFFLH